MEVFVHVSRQLAALNYLRAGGYIAFTDADADAALETGKSLLSGVVVPHAATPGRTFAQLMTCPFVRTRWHCIDMEFYDPTGLEHRVRLAEHPYAPLGVSTLVVRQFRLCSLGVHRRLDLVPLQPFASFELCVRLMLDRVFVHHLAKEGGAVFPLLGLVGQNPVNGEWTQVPVLAVNDGGEVFYTHWPYEDSLAVFPRRGIAHVKVAIAD